MVYSFQEDLDGFEPSGEYTFLFVEIGNSDNRESVEADTPQEAYEHLQFDIGDAWREYTCIGRKDIVEYKKDVHDLDTVMDAKCPTTSITPSEFAASNPETVEEWESEETDE